MIFIKFSGSQKFIFYRTLIQVDGNCVISVREAARLAVQKARTGGGPMLLELNTYRYFGHSMSDPGTSYRSRDEVQEIRQKRDPIATFKSRILDANLVTTADLKEVDAGIRQVGLYL